MARDGRERVLGRLPGGGSWHGGEGCLGVREQKRSQGKAAALCMGTFGGV